MAGKNEPIPPSPGVKRSLLITGGRGSGKSTLLRSLGAMEYPGLVTRAVPGQAVYMAANHVDGMEEQCIGVFDPQSSGKENRMRPVEEGFLRLGVPTLKACQNSPSEWVVIDEIGYLECQCEAYCQAIRDILEKKRLIAVVRKQELPFLQELLQRSDCFVVDLDNV